MDVATLIALVGMVISILAAGAKIIDRHRANKKQQIEAATKNTTVGAERDSIVVRGAEGALLLMEKALHTATTECDKRIQELEEEIDELRCENQRLRQEARESRTEISESKTEIRELKEELEKLTTRVRRIE